MIISRPLETARLYLQLNPNKEESRAIRKLLQAVATSDMTLHANEALLFQGELSQLTAALLDANMQGRYSAEEWQLAASIEPIAERCKVPSDLS